MKMAVGSVPVNERGGGYYMRLWHYKLLPLLPNSQLKAQWRELNSIYKDQPKHILINYVYDYPKHDLLAYSILVRFEMLRRGFRFQTLNFDKYFDGVYVKDIPDYQHFEPFIRHHTNRYLLQCFYNLQEKYDRGQKDFSREVMDKLIAYIKWIDN